jgi:hypothetical protein
MMKVEKTDNDNVSVTATKKEWAQLSMIIEWVLTEGDEMDGVTINLEPTEIQEILRDWNKITFNAIQQ